ncbi:MAG: GIY-YIG nuclease family protein [Gemella haemolysans]|jgi:UPF0213 protein SAG0778|uniref:GIY-YIG nuclease family protein n=1 Tax=Gemella haemolysans TaxID=1379 RepID=UPI003F9F5BDD
MVFMSSFMYVVECSDKTWYTGYTTDIVRRIKTHNAKKGAKYTRVRVPVKLLYFEEFETKSEATRAESLFKKLTRTKKEEYILLNLDASKRQEVKGLNKKIEEK